MALEGGLITSIKYAINPQGEIILVELELCCLGDYQPQISINHNAFVYKSRWFLWVKAELAWKVVDKGEKGEQVVAWYSSISLTLQLLPESKEVLLVLYLTQIMQSSQNMEYLLETEKAFCLPQVLVLGVIESIHHEFPLILELLLTLPFTFICIFFLLLFFYKR